VSSAVTVSVRACAAVALPPLSPAVTAADRLTAGKELLTLKVWLPVLSVPSLPEMLGEPTWTRVKPLVKVRLPASAPVKV
jgi:hypothetical protein